MDYQLAMRNRYVIAALALMLAPYAVGAPTLAAGLSPDPASWSTTDEIRRRVLGLLQVALDRRRGDPELPTDRRDAEPTPAQLDDHPPALRDVLAGA
jgi:hypothetical protein